MHLMFMAASTRPNCTHLVNNPCSGWCARVDATVEKDLLWPFPILVGFCRLALFEIHTDMVMSFTRTQDVVFVVLGAETVLCWLGGL